MSKWTEWKAAQGEARPWHLFDEERHIKDKTLLQKRLDVCSSCEFFVEKTSQCKKCGCFMRLKAELSAAACPIGKWGKEENV